MNIEFKYTPNNEPPSEDLMMMQLAGDLRGLKALNISNVDATLVDENTIKMHFVRLHKSFFSHGDYMDRETAFKNLEKTFGVVDIFVTMTETNEDGEITKTIKKKIPATEKIRRLDDDERLICEINVTEYE